MSLSLIVMFQLLYFLVHALQPIIVPICFVCTWGIIAIACLSMGRAISEGISTTKRLHQIPCTGCKYFTNAYCLKCTVRPAIALTEDAIGCSDYEPNQRYYLPTEEMYN